MRRFLWLSLGLLVLAGVVVAASGGATQAEARWVITDLGTLGGKTSGAVDINERGQIVGSSRITATGENGQGVRAFLWQHGRMRSLGTLGGQDSAAAAVNDRGQVVGDSSTGVENAEAQPIWHAFLWQEGKMRDLGTLGGDSSSAEDINERGQVVGWSDTRAKDEFGAPIGHAFLWDKGKMRDLGTLGGQDDSTALAINERGQVVGFSRSKVAERAFLWEKGRMRNLGTFALPPGFSPKSSEAWAINGRGQVVGWSSKVVGTPAALEPSRAVLWDGDGMTDLGTLGGTGSRAFGINERGQVVGVADTRYALAESARRGDRPAARAFVWERGRIRSLGTLGGPESGANAINERGQIVGGGDTKTKDAEGELIYHAVLWTLKR